MLLSDERSLVTAWKSCYRHARTQAVTGFYHTDTDKLPAGDAAAFNLLLLAPSVLAPVRLPPGERQVGLISCRRATIDTDEPGTKASSTNHH